jgi:hypothetical protein
LKHLKLRPKPKIIIHHLSTLVPRLLGPFSGWGVVLSTSRATQSVNFLLTRISSLLKHLKLCPKPNIIINHLSTVVPRLQSPFSDLGVVLTTSRAIQSVINRD